MPSSSLSSRSWFNLSKLAARFGSQPARRRGAAVHHPQSAWQAERLEDRTLLSVSEAFVMGLDQNIYAQKLDSAGNSSSAYFATNIGQVKSFEVGHDVANNAIVFVVGLDDQVYAQKFDAAGNLASAYFLVSPGGVKSITTANLGNNHPQLFVVGYDDQVYSLKFDGAGTPTGAYTLTHTGGVKSIDVGADVSGNPLLFAIGTDSQMYVQKFNSAGNSTSGYNLAVSGLTVSTFEVGHNASNTQLFMLGTDGLVYSQKLDGLGNSSGSMFNVPLGPAFGTAKAISVTQDPSNAPVLFAIGDDPLSANQVDLIRFNAAGDPSLVFLPQTLVFFSVNRIDASQDAAGNPLLYATGLDNQLYLQKNILLDLPALHAYQLTQGGGIMAFEIWAGQ